MPIKATCSCGHQFSAPSTYAGKRVKCPKCKSPLTVPAAESVSSQRAGAKKIKVACACGKSVQVKSELAGKKVKCPACGEPLMVPTPSAAKKKQKVAQKQAASGSPMQSLFAEAGLTDTETGGRKCPECRAPMKVDAILCIECGYNENLGRKMEVKRPVTADDRQKKAAGRNPDPSELAAKGTKKKGAPKQLLMLVVLVAAAAVIYFVLKSRGTI